MFRGEWPNSTTHLTGAALAIAALSILVTLAVAQHAPCKIVSFSVYGTTLVLLYSASPQYHSARNARAKTILHKLDRNAICLLIAGSYTPFTLVTLQAPGAGLCLA